MTAEDIEKAKELALEFVEKIAVENWAKFDLPDTVLARAIVLHGTAILALREDRHQVAVDLHNLADQIDHDTAVTMGTA